MPRIDQDRLLSDLRQLRAIGTQDRGVVRPAFSAADMDARRGLKRRYEEAGLEATMAFCLGCRIFAFAMRAGLVPAAVCDDCADISRRLAS